MEQNTYTKFINTPIGWLQLTSTKEALLALTFVEEEGEWSKTQVGVLTDASNQLQEYFAGNSKTFDIKLSPEGTDFQQKVWLLVKEVEFGETASYLDIAKQSGSKKNTRAVGLANGKNPIPIIIPCHRIVGSNGKLTGYAGGLEKKRWLLHHELTHSANPELLF